MKQIVLTQNQIAIVDDNDFDRINQHQWFAIDGRRSFYASRNIGDRKQRTMHHEILMLDSTIHVDHEDGNGLNNQKDNLRVCSIRQNHQNSKPYKGGASPYKGVCWEKQQEKWKSRIKVNGKQIHLGFYSDEVDAAYAYDRASVKYFGEFARPNFTGGMG